MDYLPIFIDIRARRCLVVGGGPVAARKVELLSTAGAELQIVAPELCDALRGQRERGEIEVSLRAFQDSDVSGMAVVIAATDRTEVNAAVARAAQSHAIPVNVVDAPSLCTFIMPALVDRSPVLVAISTGGASPVLARLVRARIEAALPSRLGRLAAFAARHRDEVKRRLAAPARRGFWEQTLSGPIAELVLSGREQDAQSALEQRLQGAGSAVAGTIALIAIGDGDPDHQSLGAARRLSGADLVLHDAAALGVVRALARRDAELSGFNLELARERARAGQRVCVVRSGDSGHHALAVEAEALGGEGWRVTIHRPAPRCEP